MKGVNVRDYLRRHQQHERIVNALAAQGVTPATAPTSKPGEVAMNALAEHLADAGIPFEREVLVVPGRKWRNDFRIPPNLAVEVDGGVHRIRGRFEGDMEKQNAMTAQGLRLIRCTPQQARDGSVLPAIRAALGLSQSDKGIP